jgi:hypothetical protein
VRARAGLPAHAPAHRRGGGAAGRGGARGLPPGPHGGRACSGAPRPCPASTAAAWGRSPTGTGAATTAGEAVLALAELGARRLEVLLRASEEENHRRLLETQEQAAHAADKARELERTNEALRKSERQSQHRAEQIALLSSVAHRIASVLDAERLMQEAAEVIQAA